MLTRAAAIAATVLLALFAALGSGGGAEAGRHAQHLPSRQPAERLAARGVDRLGHAAVHGRVQQPRAVRPDQAAEQPRDHRAGAGESWAWDATNTKLTFKLREGVKWHDGKPFTAKDVQCTWHALHRQGRAGGVQQEPAQGLVLQSQGGHDQRRPRGDLPSRPPAAVVPDAAGVRLLARLPLPCLAARHAHQAGRHGAVQVRRAQAQRVDQARAQSRLLEEGQALRRCHRDAHHRKPLDAHPGLRGGRVRHDLRPRRHRAADEGRDKPRRRRPSASSAPPTSAPT